MPIALVPRLLELLKEVVQGLFIRDSAVGGVHHDYARFLCLSFDLLYDKQVRAVIYCQSFPAHILEIHDLCRAH